MNGALIVDKPLGPTSHDVVARVRRAIGMSRIGHTGTLDPLATGVLPLVIGRATRLAQFLSGEDKEYVAGVRLGASTPTYDAEERMGRDEAGNLVLARGIEARPDVTAAVLRQALEAFTGTFSQTPPPYSAKKIAGRPAYRLARSQQAVEVQPVEVTVRELELLAFDDGLARLRLVCSSGFYVRSLAHDLGQRLGCGAHLETLRRTRAGAFAEDSAVPLRAIEEEGTAATARVVPMEGLLPGLPRVVVNERGARRAAHGNALGAGDLAGGTLPGSPAPGPVRVVDPAGTLLAIGRSSAGGLLHPVVVLV